jgi:hypothetical protein
MLSVEEKRQLSEIYERVWLTPCTERSFIKLEGMFFDVISFARRHVGDENDNQFLYNLKQMHYKEFQLTQQKYSKAKQREVAIKKFKSAFTKELSSYLNL